MSVGSVAVVDSWAALALLQPEGAANASMRRLVKRAESGNLRLRLTPPGAKQRHRLRATFYLYRLERFEFARRSRQLSGALAD